MNIFLDIDGTLLKQFVDDHVHHMLDRQPEILPETLKKLDEWHVAGYNVILTSCRPEGSRQRTVEQLNKVGIYHYSQLILGLHFGHRVLINDYPTNSVGRSTAYSLFRNVGIGEVNV